MTLLRASFRSKLLLFLIALSVSAQAQLAEDNCKFLGNVISSSIPSDFTRYWNQVTPENSGKWASVEATRDEMKWDELDIAYNFAKDNGYPFKQHTLVWGQQQPAWISALPTDEQKAEVEEWIKAYCERYPDTDYIDVVNEPLHAAPTYEAALGGPGATGWDWVIWSFEKAREYCPNAKLILNDYNILNNNAATQQYLQIIKLLQDRGLIDVIGEQGHFLETTPLQTIRDNLDKFWKTGLPVQISEYDVHIASDTEQKSTLEAQFKMFWTHPAVSGITFWGYRQGQIWRENAYLVRSNNTERSSMTWLKSYVPTTTVDDFCTITSVGPEESSVFSVYPNPSSGVVRIDVKGRSRDVVVLDAMGKSVQPVLLGETAESVEIRLAPGIYVVKVRAGMTTDSKKVIVL